MAKRNGSGKSPGRPPTVHLIDLIRSASSRETVRTIWVTPKATILETPQGFLSISASGKRTVGKTLADVLR